MVTLVDSAALVDSGVLTTADSHKSVHVFKLCSDLLYVGVYFNDHLKGLGYTNSWLTV